MRCLAATTSWSICRSALASFCCKPRPETIETQRAVAFDARQKIHFPSKIILHRRFGVALTLVGLTPLVDGFIGHLRLARERLAGGPPGSVAALEKAHRPFDQ